MCRDCSAFLKEGSGCVALKGRVSGAPYWGQEICFLSACSVLEKQDMHCGRCPSFSWAEFTGLREPAMGEKTFQKSITDGITVLRKRNEEDHYAK